MHDFSFLLFYYYCCFFPLLARGLAEHETDHGNGLVDGFFSFTPIPHRVRSCCWCIVILYGAGSGENALAGTVGWNIDARPTSLKILSGGV